MSVTTVVRLIEPFPTEDKTQIFFFLDFRKPGQKCSHVVADGCVVATSLDANINTKNEY